MFQTDISTLPLSLTVLIFAIAVGFYIFGIIENRKLHINQLNAPVNIDSKMKRIEDIRSLSAEYLREAYNLKSLSNQNINKQKFSQEDYDISYNALHELHYKRDLLSLYFAELNENSFGNDINQLSNKSFCSIKQICDSPNRKELREKFNEEFNIARNI